MKILILVGIAIWIGSAAPVLGALNDPVSKGSARVMETDPGYLENITFEKSKGKERVVLMLSRQYRANAEDQGGKTVNVRVENLFVPQGMRHAMGEGALDNLIHVVPAQQTASGKPQALISMDLNRRVPYNVRQDGHNVIVDFDLAALPSGVTDAKQASRAQTNIFAAATGQKQPDLPDTSSLSVYGGRLISLDFQDASIRSVLQLLAEESGVNIVSGDDVKGNVTVSLKKVPWDQALETILSITGMVKKQQGKVITVMTLRKMREDEKNRKDAEKEQRDGEAERKKEEQRLKEEEGQRQQISIEAKIIEATDTFVRKLGVQWGAGFADNLRAGGGLYPYGVVAGSNPVGGTPFGAMTGLAQGVALTTSNLAANFPLAASAPSFALGLAISSSNAILDAEIAAAENTSDVRIISSPKVTTMDGAKAIIKQGEDVPIVTPATSTSPATVTFKEAVLKLEVKPTITPDGRISMDVTANNDFADYTRAALLQGNPPISKSQVDSKVVVKDGETMVVGGILKATTSKAHSGLPWVAKVPILGWLFKYESLQKERKQLLIFITPRVVKGDKPSPVGDAKQQDKKG